MKQPALLLAFICVALFGSAQDIQNFRDSKTKLYGFKDKTGKVIVEPAYAAVSYVSEGMVAVKLGDKWGFIDLKGKLVIPVQFDDANAFSEGMAAVGKTIVNKQGYIDATVWAYIDKTGQLKTEYRFDSPSGFKSGYAIVGMRMGYGKYLFGVIDKTGKEVIPPKYPALENISEGLLLAANGDANSYDRKYGFIDISGKEVIPFIYEGGMGFYEGLAAVQKDGKYGFIDKTGKVVIPFQFDGPSYFQKGKAEVYKDGKTYFINKKGVKVG